MPLPAGGGALFSPNTSHVIRKQTVNAILMMSHQADLARCHKFHILQTICGLQYYFGTREDDKKPGLIPEDTIKVLLMVCVGIEKLNTGYNMHMSIEY